jgi:hypothetical protein
MLIISSNATLCLCPSLKRELERVYQTVKATRGEQREPMTHTLYTVGMVIQRN